MIYLYLLLIHANEWVLKRKVQTTYSWEMLRNNPHPAYLMHLSQMPAPHTPST